MNASVWQHTASQVKTPYSRCEHRCSNANRLLTNNSQPLHSYKNMLLRQFGSQYTDCFLSYHYYTIWGVISFFYRWRNLSWFEFVDFGCFLRHLHLISSPKFELHCWIALVLVVYLNITASVMFLFLKVESRDFMVTNCIRHLWMDRWR